MIRRKDSLGYVDFMRGKYHINNNHYEYDTFYNKALYATRQLAKRQTTWLRSWKKFEKIDFNKQDNIENSIKNLTSLL